MNFIKKELARLNAQGLLRGLKTISAINGPRVKIGSKWYLSFCSNDYLGLAQNPSLKQAVHKSVRKFGSGSGASRLLAGTLSCHQKLEQAIARFKHAEAALVFTSGYIANLSVITTLISKNDLIFCDELNHASLVDSARLTKAKIYIYRHRDMNDLKTKLKKARAKKGNRFIITDAVFSMDGDLAPLPAITRLAREYHAYTIIDEAHGTGVLGDYGRGAAEHFGVEKKIDIIIGTLSKAGGSLGGFVTGSRKLMTYLASKGRPFIYTTSLPPAVCAAGIQGLRLIQSQPMLRKRLWDNTQYFKSQLRSRGFDLRGSATPIIPVMIGDEKKTLRIANALWKQGFFIPAIRPPTVPHGQSRLRLTFTVLHTRKQLDQLLHHPYLQQADLPICR